MMPKRKTSLRIGLSKKTVISLFGEPDTVKYIKTAFRPPQHDEPRSDYQAALKEWESRTVSEIMAYDESELVVKISKSGRVIEWRRGREPKELPDESGLISIEPEEN
jgi:hypothetical protein